jgi:hypothetical protein
MACREILDRGYGKPEQPIAEKVGAGMSDELRQFLVPRNTRGTNWGVFSMTMLCCEIRTL